MRGQKWQSQSFQARDSLGVSSSFNVWTSRPNFAGEGIPLTARVRDLMDVTAARVLSEQRSMSGIYLDVSQAHNRKCHTNFNGISPCCTTSTILYSFGHDRIILPSELLAIHGYSGLQIPESVSERDLKHMVGSCIALPCIGTLLLALHILKSDGTSS